MTNLRDKLASECSRFVIDSIFKAGWGACEKQAFKDGARLWNENELLKRKFEAAIDALEYAEAAIAVFTVTAYGEYKANDSSLVTVKKALKDIEAME